MQVLAMVVKHKWGGVQEGKAVCPRRFATLVNAIEKIEVIPLLTPR
jgi:hypothetical protein